MNQSTFLWEEPPVNRSRSQALEKVWLTRVVTWPSRFWQFLTAHGPAGWFGRTSPASYQAGRMRRVVSYLMIQGVRTKDAKPTILIPSPQDFGNSGMVSPTECWTLNISEFPSGGAASSLSDILETGVVPQRYFLSAKACRGILRRAERRGKALPPPLQAALQVVADSEPTSTSMAD